MWSKCRTVGKSGEKLQTVLHFGASMLSKCGQNAELSANPEHHNNDNNNNNNDNNNKKKKKRNNNSNNNLLSY